LGAVVVADEMQHCVDERRTPCVADDLRAHDDVAELARQTLGQVVERVDRERQRVGRLVDPEMLLLERAALVRTDEYEAELTRVDALCGKHRPPELAPPLFVAGNAGPVVHPETDHLGGSVRVSSEWRLYASTIRCTSLCRTTSWCPNCTNSIPSIDPRMLCTWISPDACSRGRSICVTSPVTTIFE